MTKQINKTIRSLKNILKELDYIVIEDYVIYDEFDIPMYTSNRLEEVQFQLKVLLINQEEEYQKIHKMKGKL